MFGIYYLIILIPLVFFIWKITERWSRFSFWGPSIAIYKLSIDENSNKFVIYARRTGIISWLLKKLNIENDFQFYAVSEGFYYFVKTPISVMREFIPYSQIAETAYGYSRNINILRMILIAILLFFVSISECGFSFRTWIILIFVVVAIVLYIFSKRIVLLVESTGSNIIGARFSEGVLENVKIELSDIKKIATILNKNIVKVQLRK